MFINKGLFRESARAATAPVAATMAKWPAWFLVLFVDLGLRALGLELREENNYVIRHIKSCPDVGYYFQREPSASSHALGSCYLCFCKENDSAVCWPRDDSRCNVHKYHHNRNRFRRSPVGLSEIFVREGTRNDFRRQSPTKCKPYQKSFSVGCPPMDWCAGCTICDCNFSGYWDCHVLSFCDGKERRKRVWMPPGGPPAKMKFDLNPSLRPTRRPRFKPPQPKKKINKISKQSNSTVKPKTEQNNTTKLTTNKPRVKPANKSKQKPRNESKKYVKNLIIRKKMKIPELKAPKPKKVLRRDVSTHKPVSIKRANMNTTRKDNESTILGQKVIKNVMSTVQKLVMREIQKLNVTKARRSVQKDGAKHHGEVKKKDKKMAFNKRSKAAVRNKSKHKSQTRALKHGPPNRQKREILNETQAALENVQIISLERDDTAVIPLPTAKIQTESTSASTLTENTTISNITETQTMYYVKYTLDKEKNDLEKLAKIRARKNITLHVPLSMIHFGKYTTPSLIHTTSNKRIITSNKSESNPEFNDIKFTKWYIVKIKQDSAKSSTKKNPMPNPIKKTIVPVKSLRKEILYIPITEADAIHVSVKSKEAPNLPTTVTQIVKTTKYNKGIPIKTTEGINTINLPTNVVDNNTQPQNVTIINDKKIDSTFVTGLQKIFNNILADIIKNKTAQSQPKARLSVFKRLRTFFSTIFGKTRNSTRKHRYRIGSKEDRALQILCDNFGPCKINKKNKLVLRNKLGRLIQETENIRKSIGVIKGLLHLLQLPGTQNNETQLSVNESRPLQNDLQEYGTVLQNIYNVQQNNDTLTERQLIHINYIKENTQVFLESIKRFTNILKEILDIIKEDNSARNYPKKSYNGTESFKKLKKLLLKYNFLQNTFIRNMYNLLNEFDEQTTVTTEQTQTRVDNNNKKYYLDDNVIMTHSTNIIESLRKLKNLSEALSPRRKKRDTADMRDDAMEYLLTLMEYLIKSQNYAPNIHSGKDGIDLLIDAIKNAPDVKPIENNSIEIHSISSNSKEKSEDLSETDESASVNNRIMSIEDNIISKHIKKPKEDKVLKDDPYWQEETTEKEFVVTVYYKKYDDDNMSDPPNDISHDNSTTYSANKKRRGQKSEKVGFDKFESSIEDARKAYFYSGDTDEETTTASSFRDVRDEETDTNNTRGFEQTTDTVRFIPETSTQRPNGSESDSLESLSDEKKSKLEWIEESFDKEFRDFKSLNKTLTTAAIRTTSTSTKPVVKSLENMNAYIATAPYEDADKRSKEMKPEEVLHKKQIAFLSSLDYLTDKPEFEDTQQESKDEGRSDDVAFPNYF